MADEKNLNLEFLERSLQQYEDVRHAFFRDLKIATIVLLAFQIVIFFRFVDLHERGSHLDQQLTQLRNDRKAFGEVQMNLISLKEVLQAGRQKLTESLSKTPDALKDQIGGLEQNVKDIRTKELVDQPTGNLAIQAPIQSPLRVTQDVSFFTGLTEADINILKTANFHEKTFDDVIKRIVEERIVQPKFLALNESKNELLDKPFAEKKNAFFTVLSNYRNVLESYKLSISEVENKVNQVEKGLQKLQYIAPATDTWWRTFSGKETVARNKAINTHQIIDQIGQVLGVPMHEIDSFDKQLAALVENGEIQKKDLDDKAQKFQNNYSEVQALLQNYAKPLSIVALGPKDAVLYYPVVLAGIFGYFVWRYVRLLQRTRSLATACRDHGLSDKVIQIYFTDIPGSFKGIQLGETVPGNLIARVFVYVLGATPGVFAALSLYWILTSQYLKKDAPLFLYAASGAIFIVFYAILAVCVLRGKK